MLATVRAFHEDFVSRFYYYTEGWIECYTSIVYTSLKNLYRKHNTTLGYKMEDFTLYSLYIVDFGWQLRYSIHMKLTATIRQLKCELMFINPTNNPGAYTPYFVQSDGWKFNTTKIARKWKRANSTSKILAKATDRETIKRVLVDRIKMYHAGKTLCNDNEMIGYYVKDGRRGLCRRFDVVWIV